jgi:sortase A
MPRAKKPEDIPVEQLRRLLVEKRRAARQERLERFRRTGRAVVLTPDKEAGWWEETETQAETSGEAGEVEPRPASPRRLVFDRVLLAIEILAVVGLALILLNGLGILNELNREFAAALEQPTLTPTALVTAVVLPSGHTPPDSEGGARPNEAEIPEHLRPLVQSLGSLPIPTTGPEHAIRIQIPAIGVDAPIVQGDGWEQLKKGVGQHIGSANPGENANLVLSAHNDVFGEIFRRLDELKPGDQIIIYTPQRSYVYQVVATHIVEPTRVEFLNLGREPIVTLISCYPYRVDNQRIIVVGKLLP